MTKPFTSADQTLLDSMPKPEDEPPPFVNGLLYGDAGRHKTVTAASMGKTLVLATDPGWKSLQNHPDIWANSEVIKFVGFRQIEVLAKAFFYQISPYDKYDTFVVDNIAAIQENYVDDLLRAGDFNKKTRPIFNAENATLAKELRVTQLPGNDDYHAAKNVLRVPVRDLNQAPVNVIYIAHEREPNPVQNKESTEFYRKIRPDVTEALYKVIFRDADFVGRTFKDNQGRYLINFNGDDSLAAKSRIPKCNDRKIEAEKLPHFIKDWLKEKATWDIHSFALAE